MDALSHPTAQFIANLSQRLFPTEYAARRREAAEAGLAVRTRRALRLGVFVSSTPHFPGAPLSLHIFEPRYRVMISRAMQQADREFIVACSEEQVNTPSPPPPAMAPPANAADEERKEGDAAAPGASAAAAAAASALPVHPADVPPDARLRPMGAAHLLDPLRFHPPPFDAYRAPAQPLVRDGDIGCLIRIRNMRAHADGRSFCECIGVSRVRMVQVRVEGEGAFGLITAEIEPVVDEPEADAEPPRAVEAASADAMEAPATIAHPQHDLKEQEDEQFLRDEASGSELRNRRYGVSSVVTADAAAASSSSSVSSVAGSSVLPAVPAAASGPPSIAALVVACRNLLLEYCSLSGVTVDRLGLMHGGPCPPDSSPAEYAWWLMRAMPNEAVALKQEALACTSLRRRLELCVELLEASCVTARTRTQNQSKLAAIIVAVAVLMYVLRHYQVIS